MQKTIGIICLVAGLLLGFWGYNHSASLKGQVDRIFSATEKNRTTWCYLGAAVLCTAGVFTIYSAKK